MNHQQRPADPPTWDGNPRDERPTRFPASCPTSEKRVRESWVAPGEGQ